VLEVWWLRIINFFTATKNWNSYMVHRRQLTMASPIPIWLREYAMEYTDIQVTLTATAPMERGRLGTLTATAKYP
jgi:hypothetical protein